MGLIGRSFVIASLAAGTLVTALVMRTEGDTRHPEPTLHVAMTRSVPMLMQGDGGTTIAPSRLAQGGSHVIAPNHLAAADPFPGARATALAFTKPR